MAYKYATRLINRIRAKIKSEGSVTQEELDSLIREERAREGGMAKNAPTTATLSDDTDSIQDFIADVCSALRNQYGFSCHVVATYKSGHVVYCTSSLYDSYSDSDSTFYDQKFTIDGDNITFNERTEVERIESWEPVNGDVEESGEDEPDEGSLEDVLEDVQEALDGQYGKYNTYQVATFDSPAHVTYRQYSNGSDVTSFWDQEYTFDGDEVTLAANRTEVKKSVTYQVSAEDIALMYAKGGASSSAKGGKTALPKNVQELPEKQQSQWVDLWNSTYERCQTRGGKNCEQRAFQNANGVLKREVKAEDITLANGKTTNQTWSGVASNYKNTAAYCAACLIDENAPGEAKVQEKCHLPIYEPDGTLNLNAVRNASARINQVKGVSSEAKAKAAKKLASLSSKHSIGDQSTSAKDAGDNDILLEDGNVAEVYTEIRLADLGGGTLPSWQQIHKIGEWMIPHAISGKIQLTREMGNQMIQNFNNGVLRIGVPVDEGHSTDSGGRAIGRVVSLSWGDEGEGLPGYSAPNGRGNILYAKMNFNSVGQQVLGDVPPQFGWFSPQYLLNYKDKESGREYGCTLRAVGSTNNPFLRLRSVQGEPVPEPVLLSDGLVRPQSGSNNVPEENTGAPKLTDAEIRLQETERKLEDAQNRIALTEKRLAEQARATHVERVVNLMDRHVSNGLPPALRPYLQAILLSSHPEDEASVSLDDHPTDTDSYNLYGLAVKLTELIPHMPVNQQITVDMDAQRPPNEAPKLKLDDGQYKAISRRMLEEAGIGVKLQNGRNGATVGASSEADPPSIDDEE
jgi:hypothetical protein